MPLPEETLAHAPRESWWLDKDRAQFRASLQAQSERMRKMAAYLQGSYDAEKRGSQRMKQPNRYQGAE